METQPPWAPIRLGWRYGDLHYNRPTPQRSPSTGSPRGPASPGVREKTRVAPPDPAYTLTAQLWPQRLDRQSFHSPAEYEHHLASHIGWHPHSRSEKASPWLTLHREMRSTLRVFLKNKEARGHEEKIVFKIRQIGEPKGGSTYRPVNVVLEVPRNRPFFGSQFAERVPDRLAIVPFRNVSPTVTQCIKGEYFNFFLIAVMKPLKLYQPFFPASLGAFCTVRTNPNARAVQANFLNSYVVLIENLQNHFVKRKPQVIRQGYPVDRDASRRRPIHSGIRVGEYEFIARRYGFQLHSGFGLGKLAFLNIRHTRNNNINFPGINNFLLNTKDARGEGRLGTRPRGRSGLINGHRIRNLFRFPKLILWRERPLPDH
ncbi:hypothetical protein Cgig2_028272 [Carnegiea gigantea]|uniref:Uncharacterized protein n=1 Tax=Carnegiea gigantea TaxID=171969 RepID=A0A9Q1GL00_9CARY|nr:hypothetical protein Cgig2_028272 [Carnegiea gigantea]